MLKLCPFSSGTAKPKVSGSLSCGLGINGNLPPKPFEYGYKFFYFEKSSKYALPVLFWVAVISAKKQAPTPQAPIRNRQTRKVANAKGLNRNTNLA